MPLRDFLQGASNAAASNVSGPVDAISWVLRKAGLADLIGGAPVGGSDWMAQKGLTAPATGLAGLLGEAAGMSAPIAAAAKAPQIAAGLNKMAANAAARPTLNPQTGAVVWHGSPHKFDKFDSSKIGTGEGAQAYGHGLYLAESPKVADEYARKLTGASVSFGGRELAAIPGLSPAEIESAKWAERSIKGMQYGSQGGEAARIADYLARKEPELAKKLGAIDVFDKGNLYKVDLPDEKIARMLDWDKPLSEQSEYVRKALEPLGYRHDAQAAASFDDALVAALEGSGPTNLPKMPRNPMGSDIARGGGVFDGPAQIAKARALREAGIPGLSYLDGGSRTAGTGTRNFVVFPGEEGFLKILERNGSLIKQGLLE